MLSGGWMAFLIFVVPRQVGIWAWFVILCVGLFAIFRLDHIVKAEPAKTGGENFNAITRDA